MVEGFAGNVFHGDVEHAIDIARIVNADEIRMIESRHCSRFGLERCTEFWVCAEFSGEDFHSDLAVERDLLGEVNGPHSSLSDEIQELVAR